MIWEHIAGTPILGFWRMIIRTQWQIGSYYCSDFSSSGLLLIGDYWREHLFRPHVPCKGPSSREQRFQFLSSSSSLFSMETAVACFIAELGRQTKLCDLWSFSPESLPLGQCRWPRWWTLWEGEVMDIYTYVHVNILGDLGARIRPIVIMMIISIFLSLAHLKLDIVLS